MKRVAAHLFSRWMARHPDRFKGFLCVKSLTKYGLTNECFKRSTSQSMAASELRTFLHCCSLVRPISWCSVSEEQFQGVYRWPRILQAGWNIRTLHRSWKLKGDIKCVYDPLRAARSFSTNTSFCHNGDLLYAYSLKLQQLDRRF